MAIVAVDSVCTHGVGYTLDALDECTPWFDAGTPRAGLVTVALEFNGSWNGTVTFEGRMLRGTTEVTDPVAATNLVNGTTISTTSAGATTTTEFWRLDASALDGVRVRATTLAGGSVVVTGRVTTG